MTGRAPFQAEEGRRIVLLRSRFLTAEEDSDWGAFGTAGLSMISASVGRSAAFKSQRCSQPGGQELSRHGCPRS